MIEVELKFQLQANETDALMEKLLNFGFSPAARTLCADALPHMGFENIEPCKNAGGAVLLGPQHGATV